MELFEFDNEIENRKELLTEEEFRIAYVDSSNIQSFWFEEQSDGWGIGTLSVEFKSGSVYEYYRFPTKLATKFAQEKESFGKFFWANIRGKFPYKRVK